MKISRDDIDRVGMILLPPGSTFKDTLDERYTLIEQNFASVDVDACPGSGKTTCLLAKLILLAEQMPFKDGRGICVITHTNVAIDEVKNRLTDQCRSLFNYPNHFGTFQSFVDKFLAIPYYSQRYGKRPAMIDSTRMAQRLKNTFLENVAITEKEKVKMETDAVKSFLHAGKLFDKLSFRDNNGKYELVNSENGRPITINKPRRKGGSADYTDAEKAALKKILNKMRWQVFMNDRYLSFDDAYFMAYEYLKTCPSLRQIISKRFAMVFVDEMQDCSPKQLDLIGKLFDETVIVQKIGDPDQAILADKDIFWKPAAGFLTIAISKRFSNTIAKVLQTVCVKNNASLQGNPEVKDFSPYIITFNDGNRAAVFEKFASLIKLNQIHTLNTNDLPYKAIGWVAKLDKKKITIQSYFPTFNKSLKNKNVTYDHLKAYYRRPDKYVAGSLIDNFFAALVHFLYISRKKDPASDRYFTKTSLLKHLQENDSAFKQELLEKFSAWGKAIRISGACYDQVVLDDCRNFYRTKLASVFGVRLGKAATGFIDGEKDSEFTPEELLRFNTFTPESDTLKDIKINIATIHAVKGETHAATLYLETTFEGKTCSSYLLEQLEGKPFNSQEVNTVNKAKCIKMAYVAMSRPKWLLAFAAHENTILPRKAELERNGWKIENI